MYVYTHASSAKADHPEDERLHHTITRNDERFDLWRLIIILHILPSILPSKVILLLSYYILLRRYLYHLIIWDKSIVYSLYICILKISTRSVAAPPLCEMRSRIASVGDYLLITTFESRYRTQTTSINGTRETDSYQKAA